MLDESRKLLEIVLFHELVIQSYVGEGNQMAAIGVLLRFCIFQDFVVSFAVKAAKGVFTSYQNASIPRRIQYLLNQQFHVIMLQT